MLMKGNPPHRNGFYIPSVRVFCLDLNSVLYDFSLSKEHAIVSWHEPKFERNHNSVKIKMPLQETRAINKTL